VRRVGDDDVGIRNRRHHATLGHFTLYLANALLDLGAAFLILVFVAHFLLGHQQFLVAFPQLHRHIHSGNQDQPAGHPQGAPGHHLQAVNHRQLQRLMGDAQQVIDVGLQHQQSHDQDDKEFGQSLEQLHQRLGREHALDPRRRVHAAEFWRQAARGKEPAAQGNRADQRGDQQGKQHRLQGNQGDLARVQQKCAHRVRVQQHVAAEAEVVAHQLHHVLGQGAAKNQQTCGTCKHDGQGVQLF